MMLTPNLTTEDLEIWLLLTFALMVVDDLKSKPDRYASANFRCDGGLMMSHYAGSQQVLILLLD